MFNRSYLVLAVLATFLVGMTGPVPAASKQLIDVTDGLLYDGWGNGAVSTLSIYYEGEAATEAVQMLKFRPSFLPVLDWANGVIGGGDLYEFYASGAGASRVQYSEDPAYGFSYGARYQEPLGRVKLAAGAGYALGFGAEQNRSIVSDYQEWSEAQVGEASGIDTSALQSSFTVTSSSSGFGASLTVYGQKISDVFGLTRLSRQAWQGDAISAVWGGRGVSFNSALSASLTPPSGVTGEMSRIDERLLGNYFAGGSGQTAFIRTTVTQDVLGQWGFAYDPNLAGSAHVFRDDRGRVRFFRANAYLSEETSQGFRYVKYDQWDRVSELGVLVDVAKGSFADYAAWAREADLDRQLTGAVACAVFVFSYDEDPVTGAITAYGAGRGEVTRRSYYPTAIADQPTSCAGRGSGDPLNERLYRYDDLKRTMQVSEHRRDETGETYRTTGYGWPNGGVSPSLTFPDQAQSEAFLTDGQGSVISWPDLLGQEVRVCGGSDCSGTIYSDITERDWMGAPVSVTSGNGLMTRYAYDLRGQALSVSTSSDEAVLMSESLRDMQIADDENPCPGSTASPDYSAGLLIGRGLSGAGLPSADQGVWDCYSYDGALRLTQSSRYQQQNGAWAMSASFTYGLDGNGNVASIEEGDSGFTPPSFLASLLGSDATSFTRSSSDQIAEASLEGNSLSLAYDASYGDLVSLTGESYRLTLAPDAVLRRPLTQSLSDASGSEILSAGLTYDAMGLRASRTVQAGSQGEGSSTTSYWYGGGLNPLVIIREGITYRMIGKGAIEALDQNGTMTSRSYLYGDHLGSVRMIADDQGSVTSSLGYDGDYGLTRIEGQSAASTYNDMASFWRFHGQEQEIFPLATLNIEDSDLASFLNHIQLYHYPLRDYASGLASFLETDPIPTQDSPYQAFAANPVNFTDPTGAMNRNNQSNYQQPFGPVSEEEYEENLLFDELHGVSLQAADEDYLIGRLRTRQNRFNEIDEEIRQVSTALSQIPTQIYLHEQTIDHQPMRILVRLVEKQAISGLLEVSRGRSVLLKHVYEEHLRARRSGGIAQISASTRSQIDPKGTVLNDQESRNAFEQLMRLKNQEASLMIRHMSLRFERTEIERWLQDHQDRIERLIAARQRGSEDDDEEDNDDDEIVAPDNSQGVSAQPHIIQNVAMPENHPASHDVSEQKDSDEKDSEHPDAER